MEPVKRPAKLRTGTAIGLVLVSTLFCLGQFTCDHLLPLVLSGVMLVFACWLKPAWRTWMVAVPSLLVMAWLADAFMWRHRLAVEARAWHPVWDTEEIEGILVSPSGRTTIYVVGSHWLDSSYSIYISSGRLFPRRAYLATEGDDASYEKDISASWNRELFTAGDAGVSLAVDERSGNIYTYEVWAKESFSRTSRRRAEFGQYVESMR